MANTKVIIDLEANVADAVKSVDAFRKSTEASLNQVSSFFSGLKVVAAAALGFIAGREVIRFLEDSAHSASEAEQALTGLNVALKLSGDFSDASSQSFQALSREIEKNTKFSDEAVLQSVALAKQFNTTNEQADKLVRASADLASVTGQSLTEATRQLGQTLDGTAGRLQEQIPALRNLSAAQLRAGDAIDIVAQRFKGASEAAGNTFQGNLAKSANAFDNLKESVGAFITQNPLILSGIKALRGFFDTLTELIDNNKIAIQKFINEGLIQIIEIIPNIISSLNLLNDAFLGLNIGINFIRKIGVGLGAAFAGILQKTKEQRDAILDAAKEDVENIDKSNTSAFESYDKRAKAIDELVKASKKATSEVVDNARATVRASTDASAAIENQAKSTQILSKTQIEQVNRAIASIATGFVIKPEVQLNLKDEQKKIDVQLESLKVQISNEKDSIKEAQLRKELSIKQAQLEEDLFNHQIEEKRKAEAEFNKGIVNSANKFVVGISSQLAEAFLGPIGGAIGPIVDLLSKGSEQVKAFIAAFVKEVPKVLSTIVGAIPAVFSGIVAGLSGLIQSLFQSIPNIVTGIVSGIGNGILQFIDTLPAILDNLVVGLAQASFQILDQLPAIILNLVEQLPVAISRFIEDGIPAFVEKLSSEAPAVITALTTESPRIIAAMVAASPALISALAAQSPFIALTITTELIKNIPNIVSGFKDEFLKIPAEFAGLLRDAVKNLFSGVSDIGGKIGGFFQGLGFAQGGEVPAGFNNDTFPAMLSSGELNIDRSTTNQLKDFLDHQSENNINSEVLKEFQSMKQLIQSDPGRPLNVVLQISEKQLAQVMLNINRQGFRTA